MATTIEQQVALDKALVPSAQRLRIGRSNFRLPSDIQSKESTLQVVYDVLRRSPFFRAFLVTVDVPEIYMQEFWATATVHQHSIRFKMDTRKHIVDLEAFREMLHISRFLGHSAQIKTLTDVNVNKLYQHWRSFAAVINKNVDYAFLIWEDLVYQVEHKNQKKSNEMYYPRFTKVIIHHFMTKKPSIPRRNRVNWHYVRDDILFSTIKVEHQGLPVPVSTTPSTPIATPTPTTTIVAALRLSAAAKHGGSSIDEGTGSRPGVPDVPSDDSEEELSWNSSDDEDDKAEKVNDDDDDEEEISKIGKQEATESDEGDDEVTESEDEETREQEEESFDLIPQTPEDSEDNENNEEDQGLRFGEEERMHEEEEADELYRDVDINQGRGLQVSQVIKDSHVTLTLTHSDGQQESSSTSSFMTNLLNPLIDPGMESIFTTGSTTVTPIPSPQSTMTPSIISTFTTASQLPTPPTPIPSLDLQNLPTFASVFRFEDRVKLLEVNFFNIPGIVNQYMH
nr:hypothetical protein [Tanacetum cinerariifolium]